MWRGVGPCGRRGRCCTPVRVHRVSGVGECRARQTRRHAGDGREVGLKYTPNGGWTRALCSHGSSLLGSSAVVSRVLFSARCAMAMCARCGECLSYVQCGRAEAASRHPRSLQRINTGDQKVMKKNGNTAYTVVGRRYPATYGYGNGNTSDPARPAHRPHRRTARDGPRAHAPRHGAPHRDPR